MFISHFRKITIYILAAAILAAFLAGCTGKNEKPEVISGQAVNLFNEAMGKHLTADCRSLARAYATATYTGEETVSVTYLQTYESLMHNNRDNSQRLIVSKYALNPKGDPETVALSSLAEFFTCHLKDKTYFYDFYDEASNYRSDMYTDYLSTIGLYAFGNQIPRSVYAVKTADTIRVDLSFGAKDCGAMEELFIATMSTAIFGKETPMALSDLRISAYIDPKTGYFTEYTVEFSSVLTESPSVSMKFCFSEKFSDYGTKDKIDFPDPADFPELQSGAPEAPETSG